MTDTPTCPGCVAGYPVNANGDHYYPSALMPDRMIVEPCTTPAEERARREYQVPVGGLSPEQQKTALRDTLNAVRSLLPPGAAVGVFVVHEGAIAHITSGDVMALAEGVRAWLQHVWRRN